MVRACTLGFPGSQVVHVNGRCVLGAGQNATSALTRMLWLLYDRDIFL